MKIKEEGKRERSYEGQGKRKVFMTISPVRPLSPNLPICATNLLRTQWALMSVPLIDSTRPDPIRGYTGTRSLPYDHH